MKPSPKITFAFIAVIVLQLFILGWEYTSSVWPLWFGKSVELKIEPLDPRSLFRGDYVQLNFDINQLPATLSKSKLKTGDTAYVVLKKKGAVYRPVQITSTPPTHRLYIRGHIKHHDTYGVPRRQQTYQIDYGIEAFFLPRHKAVEAEKNTRSIKSATVYILPNGRAAVADIHTQPRKGER